MTEVVRRKFFFLITGSDLLFNKLDEIEHEYFFSLSPRESVQCDSDFKRYPVLSLKWLYMTSSDCLEYTSASGLPGEGCGFVISCLGVI